MWIFLFFIFPTRDSDEEVDVDPESNDSFWEEPTMTKDRKHKEEIIAKPKTSNQAHHRGPKRPDKPLYMPRAMRERLSVQNSRKPPGVKILTSPAADSCICTSSEPFKPETTETAKSSSTATQECLLNAAECVYKYLDDTPAFGPGEANSEAWEPPLLSLAHMTLGNDEKDKEFLPSVSCPDLTEEVNLLVVIFNIKIFILRINYLWCVCSVRLRCTWKRPQLFPLSMLTTTTSFTWASTSIWTSFVTSSRSMISHLHSRQMTCWTLSQNTGIICEIRLKFW